MITNESKSTYRWENSKGNSTPSFVFPLLISINPDANYMSLGLFKLFLYFISNYHKYKYLKLSNYCLSKSIHEFNCFFLRACFILNIVKEKKNYKSSCTQSNLFFQVIICIRGERFRRNRHLRNTIKRAFQLVKDTANCDIESLVSTKRTKFVLWNIWILDYYISKFARNDFNSYLCSLKQ